MGSQLYIVENSTKYSFSVTYDFDTNLKVIFDIKGKIINGENCNLNYFLITIFDIRSNLKNIIENEINIDIINKKILVNNEKTDKATKEKIMNIIKKYKPEEKFCEIFKESEKFEKNEELLIENIIKIPNIKKHIDIESFIKELSLVL